MMSASFFSHCLSNPPLIKQTIRTFEIPTIEGIDEGDC